MSVPKHVWLTVKEYLRDNKVYSRDVICNLCGQGAWVEVQDQPESKNYGQTIVSCDMAQHSLESSLVQNSYFREKIKSILKNIE